MVIGRLLDQSLENLLQRQRHALRTDALCMPEVYWNLTSFPQLSLRGHWNYITYCHVSLFIPGMSVVISKACSKIRFERTPSKVGQGGSESLQTLAWWISLQSTANDLAQETVLSFKLVRFFFFHTPRVLSLVTREGNSRGSPFTESPPFMSTSRICSLSHQRGAAFSTLSSIHSPSLFASKPQIPALGLPPRGPALTLKLLQGFRSRRRKQNKTEQIRYP